MILRSLQSLQFRFLAFIHRDEDGQGLAEYALILGLIAMVAIVSLIFMGGQVSDKLSNIGSQLKSVSG
jgi:pilus assembly protein Flp/PilA